VFDREFKIDDTPEAYREFSDHKITEAVVRFGETVKENGYGLVAYDPHEGEPIRKRVRRF
jgi:hypothetical protein